jgi:hypothetical protein
MKRKTETDATKQQTGTGHEIPVPRRGEFYDALEKVAEPPKKPSRGRKGRKKR